jgi:hypothetical protein
MAQKPNRKETYAMEFLELLLGMGEWAPRLLIHVLGWIPDLLQFVFEIAGEA